MVMISQRPAEVADRAVPGHWKGDLILGAHNRSAIVTLVERQTRYVLLAHIGADKTSPAVCAAIADKIATLPQQLARSLTWDQGKEMAGHTAFSVKSGLPVYFCDPTAPAAAPTRTPTGCCASTSPKPPTPRSMTKPT
jgi:IS30 family transposase